MWRGNALPQHKDDNDIDMMEAVVLALPKSSRKASLAHTTQCTGLSGVERIVQMGYTCVAGHGDGRAVGVWCDQCTIHVWGRMVMVRRWGCGVITALSMYPYTSSRTFCVGLASHS
jgi:hypothetical protein